ncbi:hypothetical protein Vretimale_20125, partial [Volvox reticuliferus]
AWELFRASHHPYRRFQRFFCVCFWLDLDLAVLPPDAWELFLASHHPYRMSQRILCVFLARSGLGCASPRRLGIIPCLPPSVQNVPTNFLCVFGSTWTWLCFPPTPGNYSVPPTIRTECPNKFSVCFWLDLDLAVLPPDAWELFRASHHPYRMSQRIFCVFLARPGLGCASPRRLGIIPCLPPSVQKVPTIFLCVFLARSGLGCASPPTPGNYSLPPTIRTECPNEFSVCFWLDLDLAVLPPDAWELFRASHHPYRMSQRIFCVFLARPGLGCASPRRLGNIPCLPPSVQNVPTNFLDGLLE